MCNLRIENQHPVFREVESRLGGHPTAGTKLVLAIEGGGMRAVITSGMCAALESYGLTAEIFDEIYGSSAGAVISSFFAAGQIRMGTPVFYEDITDKRFIQKSRILRGKPPMVLDYLVFDVIDNLKSLDWDTAISGKKLRVLATNVDSARAETLGPPASKEELQAFLRASQNIPLVAGGPYRIGNSRYLDASVSEAIPWESPLSAGATHILVLSSRPLGQSKAKSAVGSILRWLWTRRTNAALKSLAAHRVEMSADRARNLKRLTVDPSKEGPHVYAICPEEADVVPGQLEQSSETLIAACESGFNAVARALGAPLPDEFVTQGYFDRGQR